MRKLAQILYVAILCAFVDVTPVAAQQMAAGCTSEHPANAAQTLRCRGGVIIVAEDGARFSLQDRDKNGVVDSVDLQSKALLLDVPKQPGKDRFKVTTPQAIAAVRGTKWAVDVQETRTSVLVLRGEVAVQRPTGAGRVTLGPGQGVDVDPGTAPLIVKRWPEARVAALLARLGQ
jgi:FecR protein